MARPLRLEFPDACYHVFSRGNERQVIFRDDADRRRFLALLEECLSRFEVVLHAYCLMPTHYHLFLQTRKPNLSRFMHQLNGVYTQWFNHKYDRVGHLFQGRYKALVIEADPYAMALSRYIHLNPVEAELADNPARYWWSSYAAYLGRAQVPPWLTTEWLLGFFGASVSQARRAMREFTEQAKGDAASLFDQVVASTILGSQAFVNQVRKLIHHSPSQVREVPAVRKLVARRSPEEIIGMVAQAYGTTPEQIRSGVKQKSLPRRIAIYLVRKCSDDPLSTIAEMFGRVGYTAISQCVRRVEEDRRSDREFDRTLGTFEERLSGK